MAHLCLTDSVDTPKTLFETIGVPRQIVIDHQVRTLEINTLSGSVRSQ